jgi:hypothetical protein
MDETDLRMALKTIASGIVVVWIGEALILMLLLAQLL